MLYVSCNRNQANENSFYTLHIVLLLLYRIKIDVNGCYLSLINEFMPYFWIYNLLNIDFMRIKCNLNYSDFGMLKPKSAFDAIIRIRFSIK